MKDTTPVTWLDQSLRADATQGDDALTKFIKVHVFICLSLSRVSGPGPSGV
jgi:hypothetical protein